MSVPHLHRDGIHEIWGPRSGRVATSAEREPPRPGPGAAVAAAALVLLLAGTLPPGLVVGVALVAGLVLVVVEILARPPVAVAPPGPGPA